MALRRFPTGSPVTAAPEAPPITSTWRPEELTSEDAEVRRQAIWMAPPSSALAQALCQQLADEKNHAVLEAMFVALSRCHAETVVPAMFELLASEDVVLRTRALEVLEVFPQAVAQQMQAQLAQAPADVRIFLVNLMGGLCHAQVPQWLEFILLNDTHQNVVAAALEVALEVGSTELRAAIAATKGRFHADPFIGFAADLALERIETQ